MYTKNSQHTEIKTTIICKVNSGKSHHYPYLSVSDVTETSVSVYTFLYYKKNKIISVPTLCSLFFILNKAWTFPHVIKYYTASSEQKLSRIPRVCVCPHLPSSSELIRCYCLTKLVFHFYIQAWKKQVLRYLEVWKLFHHLACRCINMSFL